MKRFDTNARYAIGADLSAWEDAQRDVALLTEGGYGAGNEYAAYADA